MFVLLFVIWATATRLAAIIYDGFLRFPAQWLFQLPGTPAARLPLTGSPWVGKVIIPHNLFSVSCFFVDAEGIEFS